MRRDEQYVILSWVHHVPGFPRYSFATFTHAEELWPQVEWLQSCPSMQQAAAIVQELNLRETAVQRELNSDLRSESAGELWREA